MFLRTSFLFLASAPSFVHAVNRSKERIEFVSKEVQRFLQADPGDFSMAMYGPCYPCGPSGFTTTPDAPLGPFFPGEDFTCSVVFDGFVAGMVSEQDCPFATELFNSFCGCAANPTVSPAPTISSEPSMTPSTSPYPTAGLCYLCGTSAFVDIDYDKYVTVGDVDSSFFGTEVPCFILNEPGILQFLLSEDGDVTCSDIQALGKDCGCPPLEPTISPAPTTSAAPSSSPSSSPAPTAAPCFLCAENPLADIDYEKQVDVPALGGMTPCYVLQDYAFFLGIGGTFYYDEFEGDGPTCDEVQAFGKECGCPMTEPTMSPFPTVTPQPSTTPTASPAPTAPCSCEKLCDGYNGDCGCYCDYICEELGDCCGDVKDHCDFSDYAEEGAEDFEDEDD